MKDIQKNTTKLPMCPKCKTEGYVTYYGWVKKGVRKYRCKKLGCGHAGDFIPISIKKAEKIKKQETLTKNELEVVYVWLSDDKTIKGTANI